MAEDTIDQAAIIAQLDERPSATAALHLHGWHDDPDALGDLAAYGADAPAVATLLDDQPGWNERLHPNLPYRKGEVVWAARREMARTLEDVLARRTRALLLDARASIEIAPTVAALIARELGRDAAWEQNQITAYRTLAAGYVLS